MKQTQRKYNTEQIRQLLIDGFTSTELRQLCYDHFKETYEKFATNTGKEEIVALLVEYADRHLRLDELLDWARNKNPAKYRIYEPYFTEIFYIPPPPPSLPRWIYWAGGIFLLGIVTTFWVLITIRPPQPTPTPTIDDVASIPTATPSPTLTPSPTPTATPAAGSPSAIILSPTKGSEVGLMTHVTGKSLNLPLDQHLWLLVETNQNDGYYPQFGPIEPDIDGQWEAMIRVGANDAFNVSLPFTITLALADDKVSQEFTDFVKNWSPGQIGLPRPETGLVPETSIHVIRHIPYVTVLSPASGSKVIRFQTIEGTYDNLEPGLWHLYGAVANGSDRFKPFGPFTPESLSGRWKVEVEFSWPEDGSRQVAFNGLVVLAGSLVDQRLQMAVANGTYLTQADLMDDWPSVFNSGGEPLAQTAFTLAEQIAFASDKPGNDDIFVINADGTGLNRLTNDPALDDEPAWSPDGQQIVFVSQRLGASQLFVMNANGDQPRRLISDREISGHRPSWSPDGQWIAFHAEQNGNTDIYKVKSDGIELTQLTADPGRDRCPAWSPDGQYIAFQSEQAKVANGEPEIYRMEADGSNPTRLTKNDTYEEDPDWSPDGTKILFSANYEGDNDIFVINADGTGFKRAVGRDYDRRPSFAPDGQRVVFDSSANNRQLFLTNLTDEVKPVQLQTRLAKSFSPAWSPAPGDERIAFVGRYDGDWEIYTMWEDGQEQKRLWSNCWNELQPRFSTDGRWLVFASDAAGDFYSQPDDAACRQDRNYNIWRLDLKNPVQPEQLTTSPAKEWQPAWSPNGKQVAFASDEAGNFDIYVMNADGTGRYQLTTDPAEDGLPYWMSDMEIIFFSGRSGDGDIYKISASGGKTNTHSDAAIPVIQNPGFDWSPAVSPDGRVLIFASTRDTEGSYATELYAMNLATGQINRLTEEIGDHDGTPLWSGDGRRVYFVSSRYYGIYDTWVMRLIGGMQPDQDNPPKNLTEDDRSDFLGNP